MWNYWRRWCKILLILCNFLTELSLFSGTQVDPTQVETLALCFAQNQTPCQFTKGQFYKHVESKLAQRQFYIKINLFSKVWKGFKNTSKIVCHSFPPNRKYLRIEAKAVSRERCLTFICLTLASELVGGWVCVWFCNTTTVQTFYHFQLCLFTPTKSAQKYYGQS